MSDAPDAGVDSLEEIGRYIARKDSRDLAIRTTSVALRAVAIGAVVATILVAIALAVPSIPIPDRTTLALTVVSSASIIAVFASALLASSR